jgi:Transposase protein
MCDRIQQSPFVPGIQKDVLQWLEYKLQPLKNHERDCVLMLDEMALHSCFEYDKGLCRFVVHVSEEFLRITNKTEITLAGNALVFMIRGLSTKWK